MWPIVVSGKCFFMESLKGKKVLIVGATGGIGAQTARLMQGSGAQLFLAGRNVEKLQTVGQQLQVPAQRLFAVDVTSEESVAALAAGVLGKVPMAGAAAYSASKYGLTGMLQSIREELKRTEIRITNIFMGGVDSAFWDNIDLRVQRDKMIREEEAAKAIWFLAQQPASGVVSEMVLQPFNHQAI